MEGVILFADNKVFENNSFENKLFKKLLSDESMSVIPISSLTDLERTIETISTFKALILDWNFDREAIDDEEDMDDYGVELGKSTPEEMLKKVDLYSLIYIYSQNKIPAKVRTQLKKRFGTLANVRGVA